MNRGSAEFIYIYGSNFEKVEGQIGLGLSVCLCVYVSICVLRLHTVKNG